MLRLGIIWPITTDWSFPLHMVSKQSPGDWHPCGDHHALNSIIITNFYLVVHIYDFSSNLCSANISKLDLVWSVQEFPVSPEDIHKYSHHKIFWPAWSHQNEVLSMIHYSLLVSLTTSYMVSILPTPTLMIFSLSAEKKQQTYHHFYQEFTMALLFVLRSGYLVSSSYSSSVKLLSKDRLYSPLNDKVQVFWDIPIPTSQLC